MSLRLDEAILLIHRKIMILRSTEDVSWMATDLVPWQPFLVYSIKGDSNATHKIASDTGRESQAYLKFISEYYDCLPQVSPCIDRDMPQADILMSVNAPREITIGGKGLPQNSKCRP